MTRKTVRHCMLCPSVISSRNQSGICPECQRIRRNAARRRKKYEPILGGAVQVSDRVQPPEAAKLIDEIERLTSDLARAQADAETYLRIGQERGQEIERLKGEVNNARRTATYWKSEHLAGNTEIARLKDEVAKCHEANTMLQCLEDGHLDLRCVADDWTSDLYYWEVLAHHIAKPQERMIGFGLTAVEAIREAITAAERSE